MTVVAEHRRRLVLEQVEAHRNSGWTRYLPWAAMATGTGLLAWTYWLADHRPELYQQRYLLFWAAYLLVLVPCLARLLDPLPTAGERQLVVIGFALYTAIPKFLRNPSGPLFFDELAHWRQSERLYDSGVLLEPNAIVRVLDIYPGLHVVTTSLRHLTGLSTWSIAVMLIVIVHVGVLLGIFRAAQLLSSNDRVAGLAALVYALNPAFLFFNSQYAYQTLAMLFLVWSLVTALEVIAAEERRVRVGFATLSTLFGLTAIVTHHVVGLLTAILVIGVAVASRQRARRSGTRDPAAQLLVRVGIGLAAAAAIWLVIGSKGEPIRLIEYLIIYPLDGVRELLGFTDRSNRHRVFTTSNLPIWMRLAGFLAPLVALGLAAKGALVAGRSPRRHPALVAIVVLAAAYGAALPLILSKTGAQGAHRSFPFSYLTLAVFIAVGVATIHRHAARRDAAHRRTVTAGLVAALAVLAVGNLASNANDYYLFPGPWEPASDVRAYNAELEALIEWFRTQELTDRVAVDSFTGAPIAALADPNPGCRLSAACDLRTAPWAVFFNTDVDPTLIDKLRDDGYGYLVVDKRMSSGIPRTGFWFNRNEPGAFGYDEPVPDANITRFYGRPWANRVYASRHFDVYRLDLDRYGRAFDLGDRSKPPLNGRVDASGTAVPAPVSSEPTTEATP